MGYKFRERISTFKDNLETATRFSVRRRYQRKGIDELKTNITITPLSKEQKRQIREYWHPYTKHICYKWHEYIYSLTGDFDVRYIPADLLSTDIENHLNDWYSAHGIDNKNNYQFYFPEVRHPEAVFHKMRGTWHIGNYELATFERVVEECLKYDHLIFKCALESGRGGGISFWNAFEGKDALISALNRLPDDAVGQKFIGQHPALAQFNPTSVNTIRIVTLAFENETHVLAAYLRMGTDGSLLDNVSQTGLCAAINSDGTLKPKGLDGPGHFHTKHPCGIVFDGFRVPGWDNVVKAAKTLHNKMGNFHLISWDFAVDEEEQPVFIEMNIKYGGMIFHEVMNGPLFGDMTDRVLNEVYGKKK